jgi:hypothetical protein
VTTTYEQRAVELAVGVPVPAIVVIAILPTLSLTCRHRIRLCGIAWRARREGCANAGDCE